MAEFKLSRLRYTWKGEWSSGNTYFVDDIISYGGKSYVCLITHTAESGEGFYNDLTSVVTNTNPPQPAPRWEEMLDGYAWVGDWQAGIFYNINDLVKYGGIVYKCLTPHVSTGVSGIDSTFLITHGLEADQAKWQVYAKTDEWKQDWQVNISYRVNDIVKYGGIVYRCVTAHISSATEALGLETDQAKWETVHRGVEFKSTWNSSSIKYKENDLVKYGARIYICTTGHVSSAVFDESKWTVFIIGQEFETAQWSALTTYQPGDIVNYGGYNYLAKTFTTGDVPSTSTSDWEISTNSYSFKNDWNNLVVYKTGDVVRRNGQVYAAIQDSTDVETDNTAYWELLIPGTYWRAEWEESASVSYVIGDIVTIAGYTYQCTQRHLPNGSNKPGTISGNSYWIVLVEGETTNRLTTQGDLRTYESGDYARKAVGTEGQLLFTNNDEITWTQFGEITKVYYVSLNGNDDVSLGTTIDTPWRTIKFACENIIGPATIFIKTGVYEEILPISIPADVALVGDELRSVTVSPAAGYETQDMFYVRNGSGIRNMTLTGLSGSLGALNIYLTRRPTAGAYVSLDPGTGPSDTSVHITSRSPYIQNVTTFGTGCVGLKVDGGLHNAGNRSIVANDFTQIISDGIGAWVTNQGISELVSVFSYYGHIGYLADNGGKIRGTNGNSSYGTYGCVAEGFDNTETPITAVVNNRSTQAQIFSALSGQSGDQILILEYSHCGQNYSSATYTFSGAGTGAVATANIRNGAVTQVRVITAGDSSAAGGGSYLNVSNNAQTGDNLTITIASNDVNIESTYLGMRIVINSGTGTGQYGYIQAYDPGTKVATIYKESDNTPGWDHVAGFAIETLLDTTTLYSIEPRVTFSAPGAGTRAIGRAIVRSGRISRIVIWNCGSGYASAPTMTLTDPNNTTEAYFQVRIADGVLGPVTFSNRGNGYQTTSTTVTVSGNGFADRYQVGNELVLQNVSRIPGPGDNLNITGINDVTYKVVTIESVNGTVGNYNIKVTVSPIIGVEESPEHLTAVVIRQRYSQVRLTGHDFLDIGTGNFTSTDYPELYADYVFVPAPENEVVENGGGRVFYTSTDQDGNFRVGELFRVEQATGTVTISSSLFNLSGLEEISLGGVSIGGSGTVIREFSTDGTFTADSNNIIPTQRAIKAYITSRISSGGADALTTILTAGTVRIGPNIIGTTTGLTLTMDQQTNLIGNVDGAMAAMMYFFDSFKDVG